MKTEIRRIQSLLSEIEHPDRLYIDYRTAAIRPNFMATVVYAYLLALAFDSPDFSEATLDEVFALSDNYNPIIGEYIRSYIDEAAFLKIKHSLAQEEISKDALVSLVEELSENSAISTPPSIVELALALLDIKSGEKIAEIGSGVGGFAITAAERCPKASYSGFEINSGAFLISLMRNYIVRPEYRANLSIIQADAFDIVKQEHRRFDKVFANYPLAMNFQFSGIGKSYYEALQERISRPSLAKSGDWVFNTLIHDLLKDSPNSKGLGIMTGGSSWNRLSTAVRKHAISNGMIESIISLPPKLLSSTSIPVMMVVLSNNNTAVRMIDATDLYREGRRQNTLDPEHINEILERIKFDSEYSCLVPHEEIIAEEHKLDPRWYLEQPIEIEHGVPFEDVILNITRGAQVRARDLDKLISLKDTHIKYLRLADITEGHISEELQSLTELDPSLERYCLQENNIILSKNGYPYKVAIAQPKTGEKILATGNLYIIKVDQSKIHPLYLKAFLESEVGIQQLKRITAGVAIPNISIASLKKMQIPCPPMDQQLHLVERYQKQQAEIFALKEALDASVAHLQEITSEL